MVYVATHYNDFQVVRLPTKPNSENKLK